MTLSVRVGDRVRVRDGAKVRPGSSGVVIADDLGDPFPFIVHLFDPAMRAPYAADELEIVGGAEAEGGQP